MGTPSGVQPMRELKFDAGIQAKATEDGLLKSLIDIVTSTEELHHVAHPFNFDVDLAYDVQGTCYGALRGLAHGNPSNGLAMVEAKVPKSIDTKWQSLTPVGKVGACDLLRELKIHKAECLFL